MCLKSEESNMATRIVVLALLSLTLCCYGAREACQEDETSVFDAQCRATIFVPSHIFPPDWGVLHDSRDQTNLLGMPIAQYRARDVDGVGGVNWFARGGVCQQELRVCSNALTEAEKNQQNNWVFSSHIQFPNVSGVDGVREVFFNITYRFVECVQRPDCQRTYVTAYKYDVDAPDENSQTDPSRYSPLRGTEELSRIVQSEQFDAADSMTVFSIPRPQTNGFYLAFRDQGTCGQVRRVIVYYERTLRYNDTLLTCPTVPYPRQGTATTTQGLCCCGENTVNITSLKIICSADQRCVEPMSGVCGCAPGYTFNNDTQMCDALMGCPVNTYQGTLSTGENACVPCPANSISTVPNSQSCTCFSGYYRTNEEGPSYACTAPPSGCRNLHVFEERTRANTITVRWERPEITGRDDFYYNIFFSVDNQTFTQHNIRPYVKRYLLVDYSLSGLRPLTSYTIRVTAENGVSDQEERGETRSCEVAGRTGDIRPNAPSLVLGLCSVVVWTAPNRAYGRVIGYDVNFVPSGSNNVTVSKGVREMFHIIVENEVPMANRGSTQVQVRARVPFADGEWSKLVPVGCAM